MEDTTVAPAWTLPGKDEEGMNATLRERGAEWATCAWVAWPAGRAAS
jgi:hypothetical protein